MWLLELNVGLLWGSVHGAEAATQGLTEKAGQEHVRASKLGPL